ncbi:MAG: PQQ-binding-like beta-propeller repeat protein [Verrucomicrobiales bacterium]|nr:PQQ-binding-like beta-propeller repeat protein [Verrucomicrobiales bacterium]
MVRTFFSRSVVGLAGVGFTLGALAAPVTGWLAWRGPEQNGHSRETGLPERLGSAKEALWTADWGGQSTPVLAGGRLYILGYRDDGPDLQEGVACFDAETGKQLWKQTFNDFLSDTIYLRYSTASPAIDPETGNVYMQGTQGILAAFTPEGQPLWNHSLMEKLGRLTFPNSRTATPLIDRDLVITRGITSNWGAQGAAGDRFYAFDKSTGELVWSSSPGGRPMDNSFSHPYLTWFKGRRVMIAASGDGSVVCLNARTGEPIWRVPLAKAGINATVLVHKGDKVISIYGTPYEPGQLVAFRIPDVEPTNSLAAPVVVERPAVEIWSDPDISTSTSSPILVDDRLYVTKEKGSLVAVDAATGKVFWSFQLGIEQRNACPLYADGRLYVPILDDPVGKDQGVSNEAGSKGGFYILKDKGSESEMLSHIELEGRCFGSPVAYNGKIYIQTAKKLYAFGKAGHNPGLPPAKPEPEWPKAGPASQLQIIPSEVLLHPGEAASFRARKLDAHGMFVENVTDVSQLKWAPYIPPTALVKATMTGTFGPDGKLSVPKDAKMSAGAFEADLGGLKGYIRGRSLPYLPIQQDFESFELSGTTTNTVEPPTSFAYPPLPWIGARFRFEVREVDGTKALTKTIDNKLFQRGTAFIGDQEMKNYTIQADVRSEGTRRKMSEVGVVNQRYIIAMKGNSQELEVNSNQERLKVAVPFRWQPNVWYTLKARVDLAADGTGVVRAKAWKKGDAEPETWTIEVPHKTAHRQGSPGLFAFSPQEMRVFIDNVQVQAN